MSKNINHSIYHIVDNNFLNNFTLKQKTFMENYYYLFYSNYCKDKKIKPKNKDAFLTNMRKHKIKEIQKYNYCSNCSKKSVYDNSLIHLSRFIRILTQNNIAFNVMKKDTESNKDILTFDMHHLEIIELSSIIEVSLRDFFYLLVKLNYNLMQNKYLLNILNKQTGNDFMNIQKANNHYKKALNINLKTLLDINSYNLLTDVCSIRNVLVHNNGFIDDKFENSSTYPKYKHLVIGKMLFLNDSIINDFYFAITELLEILESLFNQYYEKNIYSQIANYYFNFDSSD